MGEGIRIGSGGKKDTTIANALIAEYMAQSGEISMNNFVEFVRSGSLTKGTITPQLFSYSNESDIVFPGHVIPIDEQYALLVWAVNSITILVKVADNKVTVVKSLSFAAPYVSTRTAFAVIGDGRVMLVQSAYSSSRYRLQGCILTVNSARTTISSSGWKDILVGSSSSDYFYSNPAPAVVTLRENEVAIVYGGTSGGYYFASVLPVSISGTTFTAKTAVQMFRQLEDGTSYYVTGMEATALTANNVIIALQVSFEANSSLSYVYCYRCVISDDLIATVSSTYLNLGSYTQLSSLKRINDTYGVIVYSYAKSGSSETQYLYMATVYHSGSTIAMGAKYTLDSKGSYSSNSLAAGLANGIGNNFVVAISKAYGNANFSVRLFALSGSSLTLKQTLTFATSYSTYSGEPSLPMPVGDHIVISFGADYSSYYAIPYRMSRLLKLAASKIDGVTETNATTSVAGKVSILNKWGE